MIDFLYGIGLTVLSVQLSTFATSIYLHRSLTHRALHLHPLVTFPLRLQLWLASGIVTKEWVAVHRKHHRYSDVEGDPHSPALEGLWRILAGNVYYYARETQNPETLARYAPDVGDNWLDRYVFRSGLIGLGLGLTLFIFLLGPLWGGLAFAAQAAIYIFLNAVINGAGHAVGYRTFDNNATNMRLVALLTAGQGLHNNHHAFPYFGTVQSSWLGVRSVLVYHPPADLAAAGSPTSGGTGGPARVKAYSPCAATLIAKTTSYTPPFSRSSRTTTCRSCVQMTRR